MCTTAREVLSQKGNIQPRKLDVHQTISERGGATESQHNCASIFKPTIKPANMHLHVLAACSHAVCISDDMCNLQQACECSF